MIFFSRLFASSFYFQNLTYGSLLLLRSNKDHLSCVAHVIPSTVHLWKKDNHASCREHWWLPSWTRFQAWNPITSFICPCRWGRAPQLASHLTIPLFKYLCLPSSAPLCGFSFLRWPSVPRKQPYLSFLPASQTSNLLFYYFVSMLSKFCYSAFTRKCSLWAKVYVRPLASAPYCSAVSKVAFNCTYFSNLFSIYPIEVLGKMNTYHI